jgi:hypothetical protein
MGLEDYILHSDEPVKDFQEFEDWEHLPENHGRPSGSASTFYREAGKRSMAEGQPAQALNKKNGKEENPRVEKLD